MIRAWAYTTILGSCVAACLHDPLAGVGGMNHFLLPGDDNEDPGNLRYGVHAMELLINALLGLGAKRDRIEAKLFGGAHVVHNLADIGARNVCVRATLSERRRYRLHRREPWRRSCASDSVLAGARAVRGKSFLSPQSPNGARRRNGADPRRAPMAARSELF